MALEKELDALFGQHTAADRSPGLAYGITDANGLVHSGGVGTVDDQGRVPDADVVFPIASMTKSFIASAALIARDRGALSLPDPITKHVPEFRPAPGGAQGVPTLEMLLGMCGGLTEDNSWVDPFINRPTDDLLAQVAEGVRLSHLPGAVYEYSNLGFALVGVALSRAVARPLAEFVTEELLKPLGLTSTFCDSAIPVDARRAVGYAQNQQGTWVAYAPQSSDAFLAAGGLASTVRDLAKWITWLGAAFRPAGVDDDQVLSRQSRRDLQRVRIMFPSTLSLTPNGDTTVASGGYALGLRVMHDLHRGMLVSHSGGLPGFRLNMLWHPTSGHGAIALTNGNHVEVGSLCGEALGRVMQHHDAAATTVAPWPETLELQSRADQLVRHWDDALAADIFAENVDFDRPLAQRRAEIAELTAKVGPLLESRSPSIVAANTAADLTWSIPGERGELLCMIHLTPVNPARIQEFAVTAASPDRPRAARPADILIQRRLGNANLTPATNVRLQFPS